MHISSQGGMEVPEFFRNGHKVTKHPQRLRVPKGFSDAALCCAVAPADGVWVHHRATHVMSTPTVLKI